MTELHAARRVFEAALKHSSPKIGIVNAIRQHLVPNYFSKSTRKKNVMVFGAGKASVQMAQAACQELPDLNFVDGYVLTKHGHVDDPAREELKKRNIKVGEAAHPLPDESGVEHTRRMLELCKKHANEDTLIINFISGGGSALTSLPVDGLTLHDLQETIKALLACGATIEELNTVRKHLTLFQGGRFAASCFPASVVSYILSDVVGDDISVIAGGPTAGDTTTFQDTRNILKHHNIEKLIPPTVWNYLLQEDSKLESLETLRPNSSRLLNTCNYIVASNAQALTAASQCAKELGYNPYILTSSMIGEAREVAKFFASIVRDAKTSPMFEKPACILCGGETTVTLTEGYGKGGRNQEFALAAGVEIAGVDGIAILSAGTDGQDCCEMAGAMVDGQLCKARSDLVDAKQCLARNDSYNFFQAKEKRKLSHIYCGPTGTNVMDVVIGIVHEKS